MATKSKEELLAEARELNLDVSEDNTVAEIKEQIANAQGDKPEESGEAPESAYPQEEEAKDNGAGVGREAPTIQEEPETSFDERTPGTPPFLDEDGKQNNGDVVESEPRIEGEENKD